MDDFGYSTFITTAERTSSILNTIERAYGWPTAWRNRSYVALTVVLHALRDRMTVDEAAQFADQLPLLIRGIFYDGWDPSVVPRSRKRADFLDRIDREFHYPVEGGAEVLARNVLHALKRFVTRREWRDITATMPKDLVALVG